MIPDTWIDGTVVLVVCLIGVTIAWANLATAIFPQCFKDAITEVGVVTGYKTSGIGACVGRERFTISMNNRRDCLQGVYFTNFNGCVAQCKASPKSKEKCEEVCTQCKGSEGCILAIPVNPSIVQTFAITQIWNTIKAWSSSAIAIPTGKFTFKGDTEFTFPDKGPEKVACLMFKKNGDVYTIDNQPKDRIEQCEVTKCLEGVLQA